MNSPAKRDLIKELYEACEEKGLGLFLYYSYGADWKHPYFYSRENGWQNARPAYIELQPEYKFKKDEDFKIYTDFVHAQLKEILTQYPKIAGIWFDPIMGYYSRPDLFPITETYALIRNLSPHALISFKQGANGDTNHVKFIIRSAHMPGDIIKKTTENINLPLRLLKCLMTHKK